MRIRTEQAMVLPITLAEVLYLTGAQIPGIERLANHTAILSVDLKALMPVHAHCHCQIKVTHTAILGLLPIRLFSTVVLLFVSWLLHIGGSLACSLRTPGIIN